MRSARLIAVALTIVLALSACSGGDDESTDDAPDVTATAPADSGSGPPEESPSTSPSQSASPTEAPAVPTIEVRIEGDQVAPNAEKLSIAVNETLVWNITSDRAGELHVHSKPEQFVEFGEGETRAEMTIETPGSVEVEDHETSAVVAILEVR